MMKQKQIIIAGLLFWSIGVFAQKTPSDLKTSFSESSTEQTIFDINGNQETVRDVFKKHEGKVIVLKLWASWCGDCIRDMPQSKALQESYKDVDFIYFSLDKKEDAWRKAIEKFNIQGEHYWFNTKWDNNFTTYVDLNWIPRYLVLDKEGHIAHYYAVRGDDEELIKILEKLNEY